MNKTALTIGAGLVLGASALLCSSCDTSPHHASDSTSLGSVSLGPSQARLIDSATAVAKADSALRVPGETDPFVVISFKREEKRYVLQLMPKPPQPEPGRLVGNGDGGGEVAVSWDGGVHVIARY